MEILKIVEKEKTRAIHQQGYWLGFVGACDSILAKITEEQKVDDELLRQKERSGACDAAVARSNVRNRAMTIGAMEDVFAAGRARMDKHAEAMAEDLDIVLRNRHRRKPRPAQASRGKRRGK